MKINELKIGDHIRYKSKFGVHGGYTECEGIISCIEPDSDTVQITINKHNTWTTFIKKDQIISKINETPIEMIKRVSFEYRPQSVKWTMTRTHFDDFFSTGVAFMKNPDPKAISRIETGIRLPWFKELGELSTNCKYKVTIEEIQ